jgi:hypothetical protein
VVIGLSIVDRFTGFDRFTLFVALISFSLFSFVVTRAKEANLSNLTKLSPYRVFSRRSRTAGFPTLTGLRAALGAIRG